MAFPLAGLLRAPVLAFVLFIAIFTTLYARRIVLATDRGIVVIKAGRWRFTPREVLDRLDLETKIGPLKGFWRYAVLNGRRLYIVPRRTPRCRPPTPTSTRPSRPPSDSGLVMAPVSAPVTSRAYLASTPLR